MKLGGNKNMIDWFAKHGIEKSVPIAQKYNSPAAELYKRRLIASYENKPLPTDLKKEEPKTVEKSESFSIEAELKKREEAKQRLQQKFGTSGLKGNSLSSRPMPNMNDNDDYLDAEKLKKTAEEKIKQLSSGLQSLGVQFQSSDFGKKLADPETLEKVKETTKQSWTTFSTQATSLWSKMSDNVKVAAKQAQDYMEEQNKPGARPQASNNIFQRGKQQTSPPPGQKSIPKIVKEDDDNWLSNQLQSSNSFNFSANDKKIEKPKVEPKKVAKEEQEDFFESFGVK